MADDGFLSRWSRRKSGTRSGEAAVEATTPVAPVAPVTGGPVTAPAATSAADAVPVSPPAEPAPLPTLDDVARLTHASDFSPYVARNVDAGVRNAAMKKLFSDPHFNVMDGLDTYIDDYGKPDPIPMSMLRLMNQSIPLGLFDDELEPTAANDVLPAPPADASPEAEASPDSTDLPRVAQSALPVTPPADPEPRADDDPDLRLQQDDADRRAGAGPRPRA